MYDSWFVSAGNSSSNVKVAPSTNIGPK